jgi:hypothetical protein
LIEPARRLIAQLPVRLTSPIVVDFAVLGKGPGGDVHAATDLRRRRIVLSEELRAEDEECRRILVHELFHFAWARLGNPRRWDWERLLTAEMQRRTRGELGWSAEWRKRLLRACDWEQRTRRWRDYACESFCDSGAWRWSGVPNHDEFTLALKPREQRKQWWDQAALTGFRL